MANLGFVGLGVMGGRIAKRLLDAGHAVTGYNRTRSKAQWLLDAGMSWADCPRDAAEAADVTFSMVSNTEALLAITGGENGVLAGLGPGKIYLDMSTVGPAASRELSAQVAEKGARMLDAPVSGSVATLDQGQLTFMVGGDVDVFEKVKPILLDIGPMATHVKSNTFNPSNARITPLLIVSRAPRAFTPMRPCCSATFLGDPSPGGQLPSTSVPSPCREKVRACPEHRRRNGGTTTPSDHAPLPQGHQLLIRHAELSNQYLPVVLSQRRRPPFGAHDRLA